MSYYKKDQLVCIQDEKDNIYFFDLDKGEVKKKIEFGKNADYEGIEILDNTAWVLKSNGNLYEVENFSKETNQKIYGFKQEN